MALSDPKNMGVTYLNEKAVKYDDQLTAVRGFAQFGIHLSTKEALAIVQKGQKWFSQYESNTAKGLSGNKAMPEPISSVVQLNPAEPPKPGR